MTLARKLPHPALLLLVALAPLACGGSGNETETQAKDLTKPQFVKQASAICREGLLEKDRQLQLAAQRAGSESETQMLERLAVEVVLPIYRQTIKELDELGPPPGGDRVVERLEAAVEEADRANPRSFIAENPFMTADEAAENYGLATCTF